MQKNLYFVLLFLFSSPLWAQIVSKQGSWFKPTSKGRHQGFVMSDSIFVYSIDFQNNNFREGQKLSATRHTRKTFAFYASYDISPEKKEGYNQDLKEIFVINNAMILVLVESKIDKSNEKRIVLQRILPDGTRDREIIADTLPSNQNENEDFHIVTDEFEKSFVICTNYPLSFEHNQQLKITAFDAELSQKWSKTIAFSNKEKQYIFTDWRYDGQNKVFFLSRHIMDRYPTDMEFTNRNNNTHFLWGYNFQNDKLKEIELSLNQRFIDKITIEQDKNKWFVAGIFSNDKSFRTSGIFNLILDSTWTVISHKIHNFTPTEYEIVTNPYSTTKNKKNKNTLKIKAIKSFENGEFALIAEEFFKEIEEPGNDRVSSTNSTELFHYQNILVFWFDTLGSIKGVYCVPKNQLSINDQGKYSSFALASNKDKLFFFFNDHPKNSFAPYPSLQNPKPISGYRKIHLKSLEMNNEGILKTSIVYPASRKAQIEPQKVAQLLDKNVYFLTQKRQKKSLLVVELPL